MANLAQLKILEDLTVHRFLEEISDYGFDGKDCEIQLPCYGSLIVSADDKGHLSLSFTPRSSFYKKLKDAYYQRNSALVNNCASVLGKSLLAAYEALERDNKDE